MKIRTILARIYRQIEKRISVQIHIKPKSGFSKKYRRKYKKADAISIHVGCGPDSREGYINCDIRPLPNVDLVCSAWHISRYVQDARTIYSRHMLEHLTDQEARITLNDWFQALAVGGNVEIVVPNLRFHIAQWANADWYNEGEQNTKDSVPRWAFAGFYGWQRECDPHRYNYNQTYWDVHKSGYDEQRIRFLLKKAGFGKIHTEIIEECHLLARGTKLTRKSERQVAPTIQDIRPDHRARYLLASRYIDSDSKIGDLACGVGYGSYLMATTSRVSQIWAMDIDKGAIEYANENYAHSAIRFSVKDLSNSPLEENFFDLITSFETIEHISDAKSLLKSLHAALKPNGLFLCSTPNETVIPLAKMKNPYHVRHYTPAEFGAILEECGFSVIARKSQSQRDSEAIDDGWNGIYNIAICRKC